MKRPALISFVFGLASLLMAVPESKVFDYPRPANQELLKTPCTSEMYPDADTVYLFMHEGSQYETNGAFVAVGDECVKIMTEPGKRSSLVASTSYNLAYGTSYFSRVTLIKPDGREVAIDTSKSVTSIDSSQMSSNIYDPASKVVTLSLDGLEVGDIYRAETVTICHKARMRDTWSGGFLGEFLSPLLKLSVDVYAPEAMPLGYVVKRFEIPGTITENKETENGLIHYSWEVKDVPQIFPEPNMTPFYMSCQRYYFGTIKTWQEISKWYYGLCVPRMQATTPEMEAKVKELIEGKQTIREKACALHRWVAKEVRYSGLTTEDVAPGYEPHDVKITFENRYGVCRDKAALLCAMHRLAGLEAYPVLILVGPRKDQDSPNPWFNHAINCVVDENGQYILMDTTPENDKHLVPAYESNCSYLIARPEGEILKTTPEESVEENMTLDSLTGRFEKDGTLIGEIVATYNGCNDSGYRGSFLRMKQSDKLDGVKVLVGAIFPNCEVFDGEVLPRDLQDTAKPLQFKAKFKAQGVLSEKDGMYVMRPVYSFSQASSYCAMLLNRASTSLDKRRFPYKFSFPCGLKSYCELDMSALGCEIYSKPEMPCIDTKELLLQSSMAMTNGVFYSTLRQEIRQSELPSEAYQTLKDYQQKCQSMNLKRVFFKTDGRSPYGDARVVILDSESTTEILDESTVRSSSKVTKKILDYAGKKANSELKLSYCELNGGASVTNVTVTMEDGSVRRLVESEINLMDSGSKASAPRYPEIKTLVVTLPGTEIGSTVHYESETTAKDRELICGSIGFAPSVPTLHRKVSVIVPKNLGFFYHKTTKDTPEPVISVLPGERLQYTWESSNLTNVVKAEDNSIPDWMYEPQIAYGIGSWKEYSAKMAKKVEEAASECEAVKAKVAELTKGLESEKAKLVAIRNYIELNVREAGPGFTSLPLSCISPADTVLKDGYGNSIDRCVLYYAMLKCLGYSPKFVLYGSLPRVNTSAYPWYIVPNQGSLGYPCVKAGNLWFNFGSQYDLLETAGPDQCFIMDCASGNIERFRLPKELRSESVATDTITVSEDGSADIFRRSEVFGTGYGATVQNMEETLPEMLRRSELAMADGISKGAVILEGLKRETNSYPAATSIKVRAKDYVQKDGDLLYLRMPLGFNFPDASLKAMRRNYCYSGETDFKRVVKVSFPEGYTEMVYSPAAHYVLPGGMGEVTCEVSHEEGSSDWTVTYVIKFNPVILDHEQYHQLHEISKRFGGQGFTTMAVKKPAK